MKILVMMLAILSMQVYAQRPLSNVRSINELLLNKEEQQIVSEVRRFEEFLKSKKVPYDLSQITFSVVEKSSELLGKEPIKADFKGVLGFCDQRDGKNHVAFTKRITNDKKMLKVIVWHELAHCLFDLPHNKQNEGSMMYPGYNKFGKMFKDQKEMEEEFYEELRASQFNLSAEFNLINYKNNKYDKLVLIDLVKVESNQRSRWESVALTIKAVSYFLGLPEQKSKSDEVNFHRSLVNLIDFNKKNPKIKDLDF